MKTKNTKFWLLQRITAIVIAAVGLLIQVDVNATSSSQPPENFQPNDHEDAFITPENERYCAGGSGTRSIKFLEI